MSILHLGTFNTDALLELLPTMKRALGVPGSPSEWRFTEGDDWEEWGEGRKPESGVPEHVYVVGDSPDLLTDVAYVLKENPSLLAPMTYPNQAGCIACITPEDDDSEPFFTLYDDQAQRFAKRLQRNHPDQVHELWKNPEWLAYLKDRTVDLDD